MAVYLYEEVGSGREHWAESTSPNTVDKLSRGKWVLLDDTPATPPPVEDPLDAEMAERIDDEGSLTRARLRAAFGRADVRAALPTGVAVADMANLNAAIDATPVGGVLSIPKSPLGTLYALNDDLVIDKSMTVIGDGLLENFTGSSLDFPAAPYLYGSVFRQTAMDKNGVRITGKVNVNLHNLGVVFDASIDGATGHGFITDDPTNTVGIMAFIWENLAVHGHDGDHYGFYWKNPIHGTTDRLRSYGGGGFLTECTSTQGNLGNLHHTHPMAQVNKTGTAHGFAHSSMSGTPGLLNLITYIRPQCNIYSQLPSQQHTWHDLIGAGVPGNIVVINGDFENAPGAPNKLVQGTGTEFIGGNQQNRGDTNNTRYGVGALSNPAAGDSAAFGRDALRNQATGGSNTAVGYQALKALTQGHSNTAVGKDALAANVTGIENTAVGKGALAATTGEKNVAVGVGAAPASAGESNTTLIGYQATAVAGAFSAVAIGYQASAGGGSAVAIGRGASAGAAGAVAIGRDNAGTGASTTTANEFALGTALHRVKVAGRLNVAQRTPTGSADSQGAVGDIASDDNYVYVKTSTGWKRSALAAW